MKQRGYACLPQCSARDRLALFLLGRALGGVRAAVIAALLFTFNNYMFGYAHEVRAYSLFALLAVATTWQLWRMAQGDKRGSIWYTLLAIALVYTHFFGWLMIGLQVLMVLVLPQMRPEMINLVKALLAVCLFYLPYAAIFISRFSTSVEHGTWLTAPVPEELYNMLWRWSNAPVIVIGLLLVIITAAIRTKLKDVAVDLGLIWTFAPLLGMFFISYRMPIFLDRYLIFAAPGFFLLSALALLRIIPNGKWTLLPAALIVLAMALTFTPWKSNRSHPSHVIDQVTQWNTGSPVLIQPAYYEDTYAWHWDAQLVKTPALLRSELNASGIFPVNDGTDLPIDISTATTVVLVDASGHISDPNGSLKQRLRNAYPIMDSVEADHKVWVFRYSKEAGSP